MIKLSIISLIICTIFIISSGTSAEEDAGLLAISCTDQSPPETETLLHAIWNHKDGDLFWVNQMDNLMLYMDRIAKQGNVNGMRYYGSFIHDRIAFYHRFERQIQEQHLNTKNPLQPLTFLEQVKGLTYLYIARFKLNNDSEFQQEVDLYEKDFLSEAKTIAKRQAQQWKEHCGL